MQYLKRTFIYRSYIFMTIFIYLWIFNSQGEDSPELLSFLSLQILLFSFVLSFGVVFVKECWLQPVTTANDLRALTQLDVIEIEKIKDPKLMAEVLEPAFREMFQKFVTRYSFTSFKPCSGKSMLSYRFTLYLKKEGWQAEFFNVDTQRIEPVNYKEFVQDSDKVNLSDTLQPTDFEWALSREGGEHGIIKVFDHGPMPVEKVTELSTTVFLIVVSRHFKKKEIVPWLEELEKSDKKVVLLFNKAVIFDWGKYNYYSDADK
jgi:hypothetical protein